MIERFVILGATGDLTSRSLIPALAQLLDRGHIPERLEVLGIARDDWDTAQLREHFAAALASHAAEVPLRTRTTLLENTTYHRADVTNAREMSAALGRRAASVFYLALPPAVFAPAIRAVAEAGMPPGSRLVVEKPFGQDLQTAQSLNVLVHRFFAEDDVFRLDHFLGKQTVQNVIGLRFANRVLEPLWSHNHVERIEIWWDETLGLEGRAGYYDHTGALRDMVQNHLLQLLSLVAMEPPATFSARDLRDRKAEVLRAVRSPTPAAVRAHTVRGRYTKGGRHPSYVDEPGVDPDRNTETYAGVTLWIDNWRWAGVPFALHTGKALAAARREISVWFRAVPHLAFGQPESAQPNVLRLEMNPDRLALGININGPGDPFELETIELEHELAPQTLSAYARLLVDVIDGDPTLTIRDDEAEQSWCIIEPILDEWSRGGVPMREYTAGTDGLRL